jgi:hypothetical protein
MSVRETVEFMVCRWVETTTAILLLLLLLLFAFCLFVMSSSDGVNVVDDLNTMLAITSQHNKLLLLIGADLHLILDLTAFCR